MKSINLVKSLLPVGFLLLLGSLMGCAGSLDYETIAPRGAGFQANLPSSGTRIVVWGNHAEAVDQASTWFHQHGLVIMDRTRLQQGLNDQRSRLTGTSKDWAHILDAGSRIGADLVAFVEVTNVHSGRKFELTQVRMAPDFQLNVEVRGVKAKTGEIISKGKAWQYAGNREPDKLIEELTAQALDWAWVSSELEKNAQISSRKTVRIDMPKPSSQTPVDLGTDLHEGEKAIFAGPVSGTAPESNSALSQPNMSQSDFPELGQGEFQEEPVLSTETHSDYLKEFEPIQPAASEPQESELGLQIAGGALSLLYSPAKILYAGVGGIVGGFAYILSAGDQEVADSIWVASFDGTYYLTPAHLKGEETVYFKGVAEKKLVRTGTSEDSILVQSATTSP